jgi:hypothetical protein
MLDDNLTKGKLLKIIGDKRFDTEKDFKDFIKPKIKDILAIPKDRLGEEAESGSFDDSRSDIYVYDKETLHDNLIIIGLKAVRHSPQFSTDDFEKFHSYCMDSKALYSVLMSETECYLFRYKKKETTIDIMEVNEIPPLNHIDYEYWKQLTPEKIINMAWYNKWLVFGVGLFLVLSILIGLIHGIYCSVSGPIKGNISKDGQKTYYVPGSSGYNNIVIGDQPGEQRFCSEQAAINGGWKSGR